MANETKIVNHQEVERWFAEGKTYQWMVDTYLSKYGVDTTISMWGNYRRRHGLDRRQARDLNLIPWAVDRRHRWKWDVAMLRAEARRRSGEEVPASKRAKLESWLSALQEGDLVVHYDPDTDEGFFLVARRPGIDTDLIRVPDRITGRKPSE